MAQSNINVRTPDPLVIDVNSTSTSSIWERWTENLEMYFTAAAIADVKQQKALLLYLGGDKLRQIHRTLNDEKEEYKETKILLDAYFKPKNNLTYERNKFYMCLPEEEEITSVYVTRLKDLARTCAFNEYSLDHAVVDQVVTKCKSSRLRRRLLREPNITLNKLLEIAYATEAADEQAVQMEHEQVEQLRKLSTEDEQMQINAIKWQEKKAMIRINKMKRKVIINTFLDVGVIVIYMVQKMSSERKRM